MIVALWALVAAAVAAEREPVAWALAVEGRVVRNDGSWLDAGEALEAGASLTLPVGAVVTVAHNGRLERWEGPGAVRVTDAEVRLDLGGHVVRWPHVEGGETSLTGTTQAAPGRGQQLSAFGVPLTPTAWARQDGIDGGVLHALYRDLLGSRLAAAGVAPERLADVGLTDRFPGDRGDQVTLLGRYLDLAAATPGAAVLFEVPPTQAPDPDAGGAVGAFTRGAFGRKPLTFRVSEELDKVRLYGRAVAESLRRAGRTVFAVSVPYANTLENILARHAQPMDGVETLHSLLVRAGGLPAEAVTVAFGYSQGAAVIREYVARYGDSDGLDYAIPVATMGGADGEGADGVWSGRLGAMRGAGVTVLGVVHVGDPARGVWGPNVLQLLPSLYSFARGGRPRGQDLALHMGYHGSHMTPLPPGVKPSASVGVGLHGYPLPYLAPMVDDLFAGRHDAMWARRGDWAYDTRAELPNVGKGDFATWRHDPRGIADAYVPVMAMPVEAVEAVAPTEALTPSEAPPTGAGIP